MRLVAYIATLRVEIEASEEITKRLHHKLSGYLSPQVSVTHDIKLEIDSFTNYQQYRDRIDKIIKLQPLDATYVFDCENSVYGYFNVNKREGMYIVACNDDDRVPLIPLEHALSVFLVTIGGMLVHSSAVVDKESGKSFVFLGVSGAGKTTIASLISKAGYARIIGDDTVAIIPDINNVGKYTVYSTPFWQVVYPEENAGDLYAFANLHQSLETKKVNSIQATYTFLIKHGIFLAARTRYAVLWKRFINVCVSISKAAQFCELYFEKNAKCWGVLTNENYTKC